jgi:signal transduction histidine kinase
MKLRLGFISKHLSKEQNELRGECDRGLGLATMKAHAQMLGGTLGIWAEEGRGTRISLTIPIIAKKDETQNVSRDIG